MNRITLTLAVMLCATVAQAQAQANTSTKMISIAKVEAPADWDKMTGTKRAYLAETLCKSQFPLDPNLKDFAAQSWNHFYDNNLSGCNVTKEQIDVALKGPTVEKTLVVRQEPASIKKIEVVKQAPATPVTEEPEAGDPDLSADPRAANQVARTRAVDGQDLDSMILQRTNQLFGAVPSNATFHRAKVTRKDEVPEQGCRVIETKHVPGKGTYKRWKC